MRNLWLKIYLDDKPNIELLRSDRKTLFPDYTSLTRFPGSTGHYDWLRVSPAQIVGLRYWPFDDSIHRKAVQILGNLLGSDLEL
jgi:hypothetical protein